MSYVCALYHIVFSTYCRRPTITAEHESRLFAVMADEVIRHKSKMVAINGVQDHLHMLIDLHQDIALSHLMRAIKSCSSVWMKKSGYFPLFQGWESEYGAFSLSFSHKDAVVEYIKSQKQHHVGLDLENEYDRLILKAGLVKYKFPE